MSLYLEEKLNIVVIVMKPLRLYVRAKRAILGILLLLLLLLLLLQGGQGVWTLIPLESTPTKHVNNALDRARDLSRLKSYYEMKRCLLYLVGVLYPQEELSVVYLGKEIVV